MPLREMVMMPMMISMTAAMRMALLRNVGLMLCSADGMNIMAGTVPMPKTHIITVALYALPEARDSDRAA